MNTLDSIFGPGTMRRAMLEEHHDPVVREAERKMATLTKQMFQREIKKLYPVNDDLLRLPAHYRNIKV